MASEESPYSADWRRIAGRDWGRVEWPKGSASLGLTNIGV